VPEHNPLNVAPTDSGLLAANGGGGLESLPVAIASCLLVPGFVGASLCQTLQGTSLGVEKVFDFFNSGLHCLLATGSHTEARSPGVTVEHHLDAGPTVQAAKVVQVRVAITEEQILEFSEPSTPRVIDGDNSGVLPAPTGLRSAPIPGRPPVSVRHLTGSVRSGGPPEGGADPPPFWGPPGART